MVLRIAADVACTRSTFTVPLDLSRPAFLFLCQIRKKNVLKDFVTIAGPLGVTHFMIFSKTQSTINMVGSDANSDYGDGGSLKHLLTTVVLRFQRLGRLPKGPMLYFRVLKVNIQHSTSVWLVCLQHCVFLWGKKKIPSASPQYSLSKDVVSTLKKHRMHKQQFCHHPLLILNNFGSDGMQIKLMATMFQNMFPSINVHKVFHSTRCCRSTAFYPQWLKILIMMIV